VPLVFVADTVQDSPMIACCLADHMPFCGHRFQRCDVDVSKQVGNLDINSNNVWTVHVAAL